MGKVIKPNNLKWQNYLLNLRVIWFIYRLILPLFILKIIELTILGTEGSLVDVVFKLVFLPIGGLIVTYVFIRDSNKSSRVEQYEVSKAFLKVTFANSPKIKQINVRKMSACKLRVSSTYNVLIYQKFSGWLGDFKVRLPIVLFALSGEDAANLVMHINDKM